MEHEYEKSSNIRIYKPSECAVFRTTKDIYGGYHNMAGGYPVVVNNITIRTIEAVYQACRFPQFPDIQKVIIGQTSPMTAKMKSKPHRENTRPDWPAVHLKIMRWCLRIKLAFHFDSFSLLLLSSGEQAIVEYSRKDDYWGAKMTKDEVLVGINAMGRLLMELREEVKNTPQEKLLVVEPVPIPEFLLFGQPIAVIDRRKK